MTHTLTLTLALTLTLTTTLDIPQPDLNPNDDKVIIVETDQKFVCMFTCSHVQKRKRVNYYIAIEFQSHFEGGVSFMGLKIFNLKSISL